MMKKDVMHRKTDNMGRIVIPIKIRRQLDMNYGDEVIIIPDQNGVVIRKNKKSCNVCGNFTGLSIYNSSVLCKSCIIKIKNI